MRVHRSVWLFCCVWGLSTACDLEVNSGDEVVLGNDGIVFGSFPPTGVGGAVPAARLFDGGTLVVENASLLGGNARVGDSSRLSFPAPAIEAFGGTLRIQKD